MKKLLIILFFLVLTIIIFRQAIFNKLVPIPFNFMAFWYEPFQSQTWPNYPTGIPHKAVGADIFRNLYPLKELAFSLLNSGQWPLWNPYIFSGTPLLANFQTSIFNPLSIFYFFFPFLDAWTITIILQPFLAGLFMYFFLRTIKISPLAALFSASAFSLMPFLVAWFEHGIWGHTLAWLPFILWAIEKLIKKISWQSFLWLTLGFVLAILGGHPHPLFFVFLVAVPYFLFRLITETKFKKEKFFLFVSAIFFSFLLTAVQLLPTFELYRSAAISKASSEFVFEKFLLPFYHLVTFFVPDFFGNIAAYNFWGHFDYLETIGYFGLLPLIFGLYALFWRREKKVLFFALLAFISLSLAFPLPTTKFLISLNLPIISTNVPSRIFFITGFSFIILAGFGLDEWRRMQKPKVSLKRFLKILIPLGFVFLGLVVFIFWASRSLACPPDRGECWWIALKNSLLPGGIFLLAVFSIIIGSFRKNWCRYLIVFLIGLNLLAGFYFSDKFLAFSDRRFNYPQGPVFQFLQKEAGLNRFFGFDQAKIIPDLAVHYRLFSPNGYDPLYLKRYGQLLEAANKDGMIKETVTRSDAFLESGSAADLLKDNLRRKRLLDLLGVKFILAKNEPSLDSISEESKFPQADYRLVWQEGDWRIYENKEFLPRAFLAGSVLVEGDSQAIADKIFEADFDLKKTIILEESLPSDFVLDADQEGEAVILDYRANKVEIETNSSHNSLLFLTDTFYPGWVSYLDAKETRIYRADYTFRAVAVPRGKHRVVFSYQPQSFFLGLRITLFSLIFLAICLSLLENWKKRIG